MQESELQSEVIRIAEENGHLVFHSTDSRRDIGRGFPDLVIVGRHRALFVELKSSTGSRTTEQTGWYYRLIAIGEHVTLWRPKDLANGQVEAVLAEL